MNRWCYCPGNYVTLFEAIGPDVNKADENPKAGITVRTWTATNNTVVHCQNHRCPLKTLQKLL